MKSVELSTYGQPVALKEWAVTIKALTEGKQSWCFVKEALRRKQATFN